MINVRVIPKLEVKGPNLIKGIHLEGLKIVGKPEKAALQYYKEGADELIYIDLVASLYRRKYLLDIIAKTASTAFIPLTVGGGIKKVSDMRLLLRTGADKVAINTGAITNPKIISEAANIFGSQCIVVSIETQKKDNFWESYTDSGRNPTGINAISWAKDAASWGAGELLVTSINQDGTGKGYDIELIRQISQNVSIPVIASGGAGKLEHFYQVIKDGYANAVAASSIYHFNTLSITEVKKYLSDKKVDIRK